MVCLLSTNPGNGKAAGGITRDHCLSVWRLIESAISIFQADLPGHTGLFIR